MVDIYKQYFLIFSLLKTVSFFYFFCFSLYKLVESEYSMDIYKSVKISIQTVKRNPEMLQFVPDHLDTKKICKHAVKKLPFPICS